MKSAQGFSTVFVIVILVILAIVGGVIYIHLNQPRGYIRELSINIKPPVQIDSISPAQGFIGLEIKISGQGFQYSSSTETTLAGLTYVWMSNGDKTGVVYSNLQTNGEIDFAIPKKICTHPLMTWVNGSTCSQRADVTPGSYQVYVISPQGTSNKVNFQIVAANMQAISNGYSKDSNSVYLTDNNGTQIIAGADPKTFQVLNVCGSSEKDIVYYAKDNHYIYCGTNIVQGAGPVTFAYIGRATSPSGMMDESVGIGKDNNCIYKAGQKVLDSTGVCVNPNICTAETLASNPSNCGISW